MDNKNDENKYRRLQKEKTHQLSIYLSDETYNKIITCCSKRQCSMAKIVREFVEKGLSVESYSNEFETIRRMIREELDIILGKNTERLIKLQVRGTKASAISMYVALQLLSEEYADEVAFKELLANASKQASAYMKQKEKSDDEYKAEAEQMMTDMQKITVKPKDYDE